MLALLLLGLAATLLVTIGMPLVLWTLSMETLRERAAVSAGPRSSARLRLVHNSRGPGFDTLMSATG
jgi:hypothetical protein